MRDEKLKTKIFLDSGDPEETEKTLSALNFLNGQTTNPTLISKNPIAQQRLKEGQKFSTEEVYAFYQDIFFIKILLLMNRGNRLISLTH